MKKRDYITICAILLTIVSIAKILYINGDLSKKEIAATYNGVAVNTVSCSYDIDVTDPTEIIGDADYYFVAKVKSIDGYDYRDPIEVENEDGTVSTFCDPYTKYTIEIIQNIKGNLVENEEVNIAKFGGLSYDRKCYEIPEGDNFLEEGQKYLLAAYVQSDGTLLVSGENSSVKLAGTVFSKALQIRKYNWYYKNQKMFDRKRYRIAASKIYNE